MYRKVFRTTLLLMLSGLLTSAGTTAFGGDIKARMKARIPAISDLKQKGIIGEDNKGYLQFVGDKREREEVVTAENGDRGKVYAAIAKQQGTTADLVGRRRALQLTQLAEPGEWLQDSGGKWYRK